MTVPDLGRPRRLAWSLVSHGTAAMTASVSAPAVALRGGHRFARSLLRAEVPLRSALALGILSSNYARQSVRRLPHQVDDWRQVARARNSQHLPLTDGEVMAAALDEVMPVGWRLRAAPPLWSPDPAVPRPSGLLRVARARNRYVALSDQRYSSEGAAALDIWRHPDLPLQERAPVVLQIPGGAWIMGGKRGQAYPLMHQLAERGWICASITYRLAPRHPWPAQIIDVKRALTWLKEHAQEFGGDPDFVVVTGGSAGGHLAALAALSPNDPAFQPGFEDADTSVQACVPLYGRYDWVSQEGEGRAEFMRFLEEVVVQRRASRYRAVYEAASPIHRDMSQAPPFLVVHGRNDSVIPVGQARAFAARLRTHSPHPAAYAELGHAQHGFDLLATRRTTEVGGGVAAFLEAVLGEHRADARPGL